MQESERSAHEPESGRDSPGLSDLERRQRGCAALLVVPTRSGQSRPRRQREAFHQRLGRSRRPAGSSRASDRRPNPNRRAEKRRLRRSAARRSASRAPRPPARRAAERRALCLRPLELAVRDPRAQEQVEPWPVRAELVDPLCQARRLDPAPGGPPAPARAGSAPSRAPSAPVRAHPGRRLRGATRRRGGQTSRRRDTGSSSSRRWRHPRASRPPSAGSRGAASLACSTSRRIASAGLTAPDQHPAARVLGERALASADRRARRLLQQRQRAVGRTGSARSLPGREQPTASSLRSRREARGSLESDRSGGVCPARRGLAAEPFELGRDALVRPDRGGGQMPHAPVVAERAGDRGVRGAALGRRRVLARRSAHERMYKGHVLGREAHEAARLRLGETRNIRSRAPTGGRDHGQVPVGMQRGDQQRPPGRRQRASRLDSRTHGAGALPVPAAAPAPRRPSAARP